MPTPPLDELGRSGLARFAGQVVDEHLRELQGGRWAKQVLAMQDDAIVSGALFGIEMLIRSVEWRIDPADPSPEAQERAAFVTTCLFHDLEQTWPDTLGAILTMLPWGYAPLEIVWKLRQGESRDPRRHSQYSDGRVGLRKLALRAQESLDGWEFDPSGAVLGVWQRAVEAGYQRVLLPRDRLLLFRTTTARGSPEGKSVLRGAFKAWHYKTSLEKIEAIGAERDLAGLPVGYVPPNLLSSSRSSDEQAVYDALVEILSNIRRDEQAYVLWPLIYDEKGNKLFDLALLASAGQRQVDTDRIITRYRADIAMSILADFLVLGHERAGSWALSSDKTEMFAVALGAWLDSIAAVINRELIPALLRYNGWPAPYPVLVHGDIESLPLKELGEFLGALIEKGLIQPTPELEAWALRQAGAPVPADEGAQ